MRRFREWYHTKGDQKRWTLATAMETIQRSAITTFGRASWLLPLVDGKPFLPDLRCPVALKPELSDYDWTRYAGYLHTDHSVRPEFFRTTPEKSGGAELREWGQDFQHYGERRVMLSTREVPGGKGAQPLAHLVKLDLANRKRHLE
jgi:hypothetical protein